MVIFRDEDDRRRREGLMHRNSRHVIAEDVGDLLRGMMMMMLCVLENTPSNSIGQC